VVAGVKREGADKRPKRRNREIERLLLKGTHQVERREGRAPIFRKKKLQKGGKKRRGEREKTRSCNLRGRPRVRAYSRKEA